MKRYGIRITLPPGHTLAAPHLLGPAWESFRWYGTADARDRALSEMTRSLPNYRRGDHPPALLERVEQEA